MSPTATSKTSRASRALVAAGGYMLLGWEGTGLEEPLELVEKFRPAGLVFFKRNYPGGGGEELRRQLRALQARALEVMDRPLLIAVDHEGGTVRRLPAPHLQTPSARESFERGGLGGIFETALNAGRELAWLGFNLNLAPVLDLRVEGSFLTTRCFSSDPAEVAACAKVFVDGFRQAGVLCCGKHFPGLGAAGRDPHAAMPSVELDKKQMQSHLRPFKDLVEAGLPMIMTSHCLYPGAGLDKPATFAKEIPDLLRRELNFEGLILSDDLEMGAVTTSMTPGEAALGAVLAGHDLVLVCRRRELALEARAALAGALESGVICDDQFVGSYGRLCSVVDASLGFE
ncbi:MAG: hypothetical protein LBP95_06175 [Deltaproteobacteria bacterium]|nr:hypothetical protein [Deltaproteobacteria bacterium]